MNQLTTETGQVASFFEGYAGSFDSIYGHTSNRNSFQKLIDQVFRKTMFQRFRETLNFTSNSSIQSIIDIGCGPGHYCLAFLKQHKKVVGLDLSERMITIAKQNIQQEHVKGDIQFLKGDYLDFSFKKKFDAACLMGFFDYIKSPDAVLLKLKKDVAKEVYASFPKSNGVLAVQRKFRYKLRHCPLYLYSRSDIERLMKDAGIRHYEFIDCNRDWFIRMQLDKK
jgi:ubiquinone/menaquinone biosynthesis C-methylase UbiE